MNKLQGIYEEGTDVNDVNKNVQVDNFGWAMILLFSRGIIVVNILSPKLLSREQRNSKSRIT